MSDLVLNRGATYGDNKRLRFTLSRSWGQGKKLCYIGHNPSTADHEHEDPTTKAWIYFAQSHGFEQFVAVNIYPFRHTDPKECRHWVDFDPFSRDMVLFNRNIVSTQAKKADLVVGCWGAIAQDDIWVEEIIESIQCGYPPFPDIYCFGTTNSGAPKHPLARGKYRVPRTQRFELWRKA